MGRSRRTYYSRIIFSVYSTRRDRDDYRFGFNTQEKLDEIAGIGNHNTALFWEYDTRLGRRWNLDPVDQISISNYAVNGLNPIWYNDPKGDDYLVKNKRNKKGEIKETTVSVTVYIQGDGASKERAEELTSSAKEVYKSKTVDGVKLNFDINYVYDENKEKGDLKKDENILMFNPEKGRAYITGYEDGKGVYHTGNTGQIFESGKKTGTILHETGHLLGLSDRYYESGGAPRGKDFQDGKDLMYDSTVPKLKTNHYRNIIHNIINIDKNTQKVYPGYKVDNYTNDKFQDRKKATSHTLIDE